MPDQSPWPNADADKEAELADASSAFLRLSEAQRRLLADPKSAPALSHLRSHIGRRESALLALQRHAVATLASFAFLDGQHIAHQDPRLLEAFYTDPMDCVASRYCWALLAFNEQTRTLSDIIAAIEAEYQAFTQRHRKARVSGHDNLAATEVAHSDRADRLAYRAAVLRRLSLIQRNVEAEASLTSEVESSAEAAMEAADVLRDIRRARVIR